MSDIYKSDSQRSVRKLRPNAREPFPPLNRSEMISDARLIAQNERKRRLESLARILTVGLEGLRSEAK